MSKDPLIQASPMFGSKYWSGVRSRRRRRRRVNVSTPRLKVLLDRNFSKSLLSVPVVTWSVSILCGERG